VNWRADVLAHFSYAPIVSYRGSVGEVLRAVRARGGCSDAYRNGLRAIAHAMSEVRTADAACRDRAVTIGAGG
jgi:hypothetical protein